MFIQVSSLFRVVFRQVSSLFRVVFIQVSSLFRVVFIQVSSLFRVVFRQASLFWFLLWLFALSRDICLAFIVGIIPWLGKTAYNYRQLLYSFDKHYYVKKS